MPVSLQARCRLLSVDLGDSEDWVTIQLESRSKKFAPLLKIPIVMETCDRDPADGIPSPPARRVLITGERRSHDPELHANPGANRFQCPVERRPSARQEDGDDVG